MIGAAGAYERELGSLMTAAWAADSADALSRELTAVPQEQMRCAA